MYNFLGAQKRNTQTTGTNPARPSPSGNSEEIQSDKGI